MRMDGGSIEKERRGPRRGFGVRQLAAALSSRACSRPSSQEAWKARVGQQAGLARAVASYRTPERFAPFHAKWRAEGSVKSSSRMTARTTQRQEFAAPTSEPSILLKTKTRAFGNPASRWKCGYLPGITQHVVGMQTLSLFLAAQNHRFSFGCRWASKKSDSA